MTIDLGKITQGERGTLTFAWEFPEGLTSPATVMGATITAIAKNLDTGDVTTITGALTGTAATTVTWALSAGDSGTAGTYAIVFRAVVSGTATYTLDAALDVQVNPSATATQNYPLVGVSADDAAWLAVSADAALGTAAYEDATAFEAAGTAAAALAADTINLGIDGTIMDVTIASANEDAPWTLTTRSSTFESYRDDWMNFGNNMYPVGDNTRAGWALQMENGYLNPSLEYTSEAFFQYFAPGSYPVVGEVRRPFQINMYWADHTAQILLSGETRFSASAGGSTSIVMEDGGNVQVQNGKYIYANNAQPFIQQLDTEGTARDLVYLSNSNIIIFGEAGINSNIIGDMSYGDAFGPANVLDVRGTRTPSANYQAVSVTTTINPTAGTNFYGLYTKPTINIPNGVAASYAVGNYFQAPTVTKTGTGSVTYAATVMVAGAPSNALVNYALWVDSGMAMFSGDFRADAKFGFGVAPQSRQTVTGSRGGNAALASLLTMLAFHGIIANGTTA